MTTRDIKLREALGLTDIPARLRESWVALRGAPDVPPSRFGLSSLRQFRPRLGIPLWRGRFVIENHTIITNLFNHEQTPIADGWSVRTTQVRDFRGRRLTYDSHNGTDFAVPVGTTVTAAAAGRVVRSYCEYNRGGNKIIIDHGEGLFTSCAHLARPLVTEGQEVARGEPIALSGYSGLDAVVTGPFGVPHVHFSVWYGAEAVDPFGYADVASLWIGDEPMAPDTSKNDAPNETTGETTHEPTRFDEAAVNQAVASCLTESVRDRLAACGSVYERACLLTSEWNYYPTRFPHRPAVVCDLPARRGRLSLPFTSQIQGVIFADDL